ncbi:MAG: T9SS type A sorting domain-containing protein [Bacteroidota bacterium]
MKAKLFSFFLFLSCLSYGQQWTVVGTSEFSNQALSARLAFSPNGEPYVVYNDINAGNKTRVSYFDGTSWIDLGTVSNSAADSESIAFNPTDNSVWVAHAQTSNRLVRMFRYNGSSWSTRTIFNSASQNRYNEHLGLYYDANFGSPIISCYTFPQLSAASGIAQNAGIVPHFVNSNSGGSNGTNIAVGRNNTVTVDKYGNFMSNITNDDVFTSFMDRRAGVGTNGNFTRNFSEQAKHYALINNRWIAHTRDFGASVDVLQYYQGTTKTTAQPLGNPNTQGNLVDIDMQSDFTVYITYANTNDEVAIERYDGTWQVVPNLPIINSTSTGFFHQIAVNESTDELYYMYRDNGSITVLKYSPPAPLSRYYVDVNATGSGDGSSWADAMTNVNDAIDVAGANTTEIWLAAGTYFPRAVGGVSSTITLSIDNLTIYGGFAGTETQLSERNIRMNETIVSGDISQNDTGVVFNTTSRSDNATHVFTIAGDNITLDGITISDGDAGFITGNGQHGPAIYKNFDVTSLSIKNCTIKNNVGQGAGAIFARFDGSGSRSVTIENCIFTNNLSRYGATLYTYSNANISETVTISNSLFYDNAVADSSAGNGISGIAWIRAFGNNSSCTTSVVNCTFVDNSSTSSETNITENAALQLSQDTGSHTATIANTIFYHNTGQNTTTLAAIGKGRSTYNAPTATLVTHTIDEDNFSFVTNTNSVSTNDPMFTDLAAKDYTLQNGSPAVNTGDNTYVPATTLDLAFNNRILDTTVDLGAFENTATLSVSDIEAITFSVFPNPTDGFLKIHSPYIINNVEVYSQIGTKVLETNQNTISLANLPSGMYILKISTLQNQAFIKKVIKN